MFQHIETKYVQIKQKSKWVKTTWKCIGCDNQRVITLNQNHKYHSKMKHMEVQHHYIQKLLMKGYIFMWFIMPQMILY